MNRFAVIFAIAVAGLSVNSAWAADGDEQLVTSSRTATSPSAILAAAASTPATKSDGVQQLNLQDASTVAPYDAGTATGLRPNLSLIHGSVGVSIGTGGYRSAYVSAIMPVGNDGLLGIAVKQTDYGKNGGFYDYGDYGYGYGYGRGYGRHGLMPRVGKQTSVAVALDMGDGESSPDVPAGCAPGFRDGDGRYVEPVWVTKLHGNRSCEVTVPDPSPQQ
jgi:hypothetical protein